MKTLIELERIPTAPKFIDERGGLYNAPVVKLYKNNHDIDDFLTLIFGFYLNDQTKHPIFQFSLTFNSDNIPQVGNATDGFLELGKPSYSKLLNEYLEFGKDGKVYLINPAGKYWFTHSPLCHIPNSLNEIGLENWQFKTQE